MINLPSILDQIAASSLSHKTTNCRIEASRSYLRDRLDKEGRRQLLSIIDEKDLLIELESMRHFKQGFRLGLRLAAETLYLDAANGRRPSTPATG